MTALARRFYKTALPTADHGVALDQRTLRTPGGAVFTAPTAALAAAVAAEWDAQGEEIIPASMPLSQLAFAAIDWAAPRREELVHYVGAYIETDLCAHRAEAPAELAARQSAAWDPLLAWAAEAHGLTPPVVSGVIAANADPAMREHLAAYARALDDFSLTALAQGAGLSGSAVIALALLDKRLSGKAAFEAAALDNLWSLERWGEDAEARAKLDRQAQEFDNIARFIETLG
ncbi:MAG TPA: ATP12 family protein [Terricaulis sp.]|nr:ATP12 family protein [Terricaulis sp.]